jgi:chitinase
VNLDCVNILQPCLHYNSIINHNPLTDYRNNECPYKKQDSRRQADLKAKADWEKEHPKNGWWDKIPPIAGAKDCEADEWPPAALYYSRDGYAQLQGSGPRTIDKPQFIRLMDGNENGRAGAPWQCPAIARREDTDTSVHSAVGADGTTTSYTDVKCIYTRTTYRVNLPGLVQPDNDDGLEVNSCYPRGNAGTDYRGFAVLNDDPWYGTNPGAKVLTAGYLNSPPFKRGWVDPDLIVALEANSSRKVSDEELRDKFGLVKCESEGCEDELEEFAEEGAVVYGPPLEAPADAPVLATTLMPAPTVVTPKDAPTPRKGVSPVEFPLQTQS